MPSSSGSSTAWFLLIGAGLLEIVWATALKHADGFTRLWPSILGITVSCRLVERYVP